MVCGQFRRNRNFLQPRRFLTNRPTRPQDTTHPFKTVPHHAKGAAHREDPASLCRAGRHHQVSISAGAFVLPGPAGPSPHIQYRAGQALERVSRPETRASWWFEFPAFTPQAMSKPFGRRLPVETIRSRRGTGNPSGFHRPERRRRGANPEKTAVLALEARNLGGNLRSGPRCRDFLRLRRRQTLPLQTDMR